MPPLEQEYSGHSEGESDLKQMCQPGENCRNQVGSQLLLQLCSSFSSKRRPNVMQCTNKNKPCIFQTPAYQRILLSQGKHPDS